MRTLLRDLASFALGVIAETASRLPDNDYFHAYTITNGTTRYLTRVKFPRIFGKRVMLHRIWRADTDREMHNHPWDKAVSIILTGSYWEERLDRDSEALLMTLYNLGQRSSFSELLAGVRLAPPPPIRSYRHVKWFNSLSKEDFHKITDVNGPLWTLFIAGERTRDKNGVDWGFLDEETRKLIPHQEYIIKSGAQKT